MVVAVIVVVVVVLVILLDTEKVLGIKGVTLLTGLEGNICEESEWSDMGITLLNGLTDGSKVLV